MKRLSLGIAALLMSFSLFAFETGLYTGIHEETKSNCSMSIRDDLATITFVGGFINCEPIAKIVSRLNGDITFPYGNFVLEQENGDIVKLTINSNLFKLQQYSSNAELQGVVEAAFVAPSTINAKVDFPAEKISIILKK